MQIRYRKKGINGTIVTAVVDYPKKNTSPQKFRKFPAHAHIKHQLYNEKFGTPIMVDFKK